MSQNPEIGARVRAGGIDTNLHDVGQGPPILLLHGSGPGVSAWANWRLTIPELSKRFRVIAPDIVGYGFTERPAGVRYDMDTWVAHAIGVLDALGLEKVGVIGNSFGGGLTLHLAVRHPERVSRCLLMGAVGVRFDMTPGLELAWGYTPSFENMRKLLDVFAFDRSLVTDELAEMRYQASIRPGFQEAFSAMFPAPRQRWIEAMALPEEKLRALEQEVLIIHGRDDKIVPVGNAFKFLDLIPRAQLHVFGRCGHWTQIEHNRRFNQLASDFFAEGA